MRNDIIEQARAIKAAGDSRAAKLEEIRALVVGLGSGTPTLTKLSAFFQDLQTIMQR